jgi:parvulin-like peptidyl-prolyl isomerase
MLQAMRQNTKVILWVTIIFFVLLIFLVWGADLQGPGGGGSRDPGAIGKVNGEPIPVAAYQNAVAQNRRFATSQGRDLQPSDLLFIEEDSWNSVVDEMLLVQEAERRGLRAHDSEIRTVLLNEPPQIIRTDPNFLNEQGQFDLNRYRQLLLDPATPESFLLSLESYVRANLPLQKLAGIIQASAKVTDAEVRRTFVEQNERVRATYVLVDAVRQTVDTEVADAALAEHFQANQEDYRFPRRADIDYVFVPRQATSADTLQLLADLREFRREALGAKDASPDDVMASDFETLATTFSDGPNADEGGLSAGYITPDEMTPAMQEAVGDLAVGEISGPFLDGGFYHIVQIVDEKIEGDAGRSVQIRDLALRVGPSDSTVAAVRERLDAVREAAAAGNLDSAAEAAGLTVSRAGGVSADGIVPGLAAIPRVADFALHNEVGTVSRVYETNSGSYVLEVAAIHDPGVPALDVVRERVRQDVLAERRFAAAREIADRISEAVAAGDSLGAAAEAEGLSTTAATPFTRQSGIPGLGRDPDVIAAAFTLPEGEASLPVRGARGWVILRVDEKIPVDETAFATQAPQIRQNLLGIKQSQIYNAWMEGLRTKAKVEDYRI